MAGLASGREVILGERVRIVHAERETAIDHAFEPDRRTSVLGETGHLDRRDGIELGEATIAAGRCGHQCADLLQLPVERSTVLVGPGAAHWQVEIPTARQEVGLAVDTLDIGGPCADVALHAE